MADTRDLVRPVAAGIAVAAFVPQAAAYAHSALTHANPVHCLVWPFGDSDPILSSGDARLLDFAGASVNFESFVAVVTTPRFRPAG